MGRRYRKRTISNVVPAHAIQGERGEKGIILPLISSATKKRRETTFVCGGPRTPASSVLVYLLTSGAPSIEKRKKKRTPTTSFRDDKRGKEWHMILENK